MAVNLNSIGNYDTKSINNSFRKMNTKNQSTGATEKIDTDEKMFFSKLYPEKRNEIMNYSFYERTGKMNGVSVGTNFDKKG